MPGPLAGVKVLEFEAIGPGPFAGMLALTHIVPPDVDPSSLLTDARRQFAGPVVVGEDLLAIDVERRTASWRGLAVAFG